VINRLICDTLDPLTAMAAASAIGPPKAATAMVFATCAPPEPKERPDRRADAPGRARRRVAD
jgi:hypothetical protein